MSTQWLKLIAAATMLLDHIGFVTQNLPLRMIGRLSFPIFAFLIANGHSHTRNATKYAIRLLVFAFISEIPFDLFTTGSVSFFTTDRVMFDNSLFTLVLGLAFIVLYGLYKKHFPEFYRLPTVITLLVIGLGASYISADYGFYGVLWVALFGVYDVRENNKNKVMVAIGATLLATWKNISKVLITPALTAIGINLSGLPGINVIFPGGAPSQMELIQMLSVFAVIPILLYNGQGGIYRNKYERRIVKYAFYVFYPLHIAVLYYLQLKGIL